MNPVRMTQDNILLELEPLETSTPGGIVHPGFVYEKNRSGEVKIKRDPRLRKGVRFGRVLAAGPGHFPGCRACGGQRCTFIPTEVRVGDRVVVDALAGQDYSLDVTAPRHHKRAQQFQALSDRVGEFRVVREGEIHGVDTDALPDTVREPRAGE